MIILKLKKEIEFLREVGKIVVDIYEVLRKVIFLGIFILELDKIVEENIRKYNVEFFFKGYGGFLGSICVFINREVVYGILGEIIL